MRTSATESLTTQLAKAAGLSATKPAIRTRFGESMTRPSHVLGIDPGLAGALALLNCQTKAIEFIADMPVTSGKVDPVKLAAIIDLCKVRGTIHAAVENVNARPRQAGMWNFALGVGAIHGCLAALGIPFTLVQPAAWKSACGLRRLESETQADTKKKARELAARLFPESADLFRRVRDDGRAESVLVGRFLAVKNGWF